MSDSRFRRVLAAFGRRNIMAEGYQSLWEAIGRHLKLVTVLMVVVILASIFGMRRLSYNHDVDVMLPADETVQRTMHFLRTANFSHEVILLLRTNDSRHSPVELLDVAERLLGSIDSPLVSPAMGNVGGSDVMQDIVSFMRYTPQLQTPEGYSQMTTNFTPAYVQKQLRSVYLQCLKPALPS